jgi:DNA-binding beta-propeller fold protein YncE
VRLAAIIAVLALLGGCASSRTPAVLTYGIEDAPEGRHLMWPAPPEVPRYQYAGVLTGEGNFKRQGEDAQRGAKGFLRWLVGLDASNERATVLQRPQSGSVDAQGRVVITDMSRRAVFVFDPNAGELQVWDRAVGARGFVGPTAAVPGPDGQLYVSDADLGVVVRLDAKGTPAGTLGKGVLKRPTGMARDAERGVLYVADTRAHDIKLFADDGRLLSTLGHRGEGDGEFNGPTHLAFAQGKLYVTDTLNARIQVFERDSALPLRKIGQRGLYVGNLVRPKGVAVDGEGNVYVVEGYHDYVLVFNAEGEFLMPIGGTGPGTGNFYLPAGIWVDARNRVFVADMFNGRVVVFQFLGSG